MKPTWSRTDDGRSEVEAVSGQCGDPSFFSLDEALDELENHIAVDGLSQTR